MQRQEENDPVEDADAARKGGYLFDPLTINLVYAIFIRITAILVFTNRYVIFYNVKFKYIILE